MYVMYPVSHLSNTIYTWLLLQQAIRKKSMYVSGFFRYIYTCSYIYGRERYRFCDEGVRCHDPHNLYYRYLNAVQITSTYETAQRYTSTYETAQRYTSTYETAQRYNNTGSMYSLYWIYDPRPIFNFLSRG